MSNEKRDEFLSWRGILDQPDALPEQGLDRRDLSWERLDARLREKSRRPLPGCLQGIPRRPVLHLPLRYRIVAACLVLAIIPALYLFHHKPAGLLTPTRPPAAGIPSPVARPTTAPPAVIPATALPSQELVDNTTILHSGPSRESLRKRSVQSSARTSAQTSARIPGQTISSAPLTPIINNPPLRNSPVLLVQGQEQFPEKKAQSLSKILINKPLRVVHINELEDAGHPEPAMTSIRERDGQLRVLIILKNH